VFLLGLTHCVSQFVFGIPREYAFLIFYNKRAAAGGTSDIHSAVHSQFDVLSRLVSEIAWLGVNVFFLTLSLYQY
jgi:hypothetical protein